MKAPIKENHYPGTLNFGDAFPVTVEAICFLEFVEIDGLTLFLMVVAAAAGAWIGVGIVSKLDIQKIRIAMAVCLIATAVVLFCKVSEIGPFEEKKSDLAVEDVENESELVSESVENESDSAAKDVGNESDLGLRGVKLVIGIVVNFFLGALMMIGFGLYVPCTALVALLGMSVGAAFPIMMGSCCLLMNVSVPKWYQTGAYDINATVHSAVFGSLGAGVAYLLTKYMFDMEMLTYLMCCVMVFTGLMYARDASAKKKASYFPHQSDKSTENPGSLCLGFLMCRMQQSTVGEYRRKEREIKWTANISLMCRGILK